MRWPSGRLNYVLLFITSIVVYSTAWALLGSFEKRTVPEDFLNRYLPIAQGIADRGDFLLGERAPSPPLYPLALAGLMKLGGLFNISSVNMAKAFNVMAMALLAVLFYAMASRFLGPRIGLLTALVWLTYPFGIYLSLQPGPETLYLLFLIIAARATLEAGKGGTIVCLAAGMAGALAMLVKPMALFLPLALMTFLMVIWILRRVPLGRFVLSCSLFIAGLLLAVLPWEAYLWQRTGRFIPVADKAGSAIYDGWTFGLQAGAGGDRVSLPGDVETYMREVERLSVGKGSGEVISSIVHSAKKHPGAFLKLMFIKMGRCWYGTDEMWHEGKILVIQICYLALSLIGAVFWSRSGRQGVWLIMVLAIILLYHWAAATAALSILRYMMSSAFLMAVLAAMSLTQCCSKYCMIKKSV